MVHYVGLEDVTCVMLRLEYSVVTSIKVYIYLSLSSLGLGLGLTALLAIILCLCSSVKIDEATMELNQTQQRQYHANMQPNIRVPSIFCTMTRGKVKSMIHLLGPWS